MKWLWSNYFITMALVIMNFKVFNLNQIFLIRFPYTCTEYFYSIWLSVFNCMVPSIHLFASYHSGPAEQIQSRVNSPNTGCLPNTGYRPLNTIMSHFAAFDPIINWWAALRPLALLYSGGPLCGPIPVFGKHPVFSEFTLYKIWAYNHHSKNH